MNLKKNKLALIVFLFFLGIGLYLSKVFFPTSSEDQIFDDLDLMLSSAYLFQLGESSQHLWKDAFSTDLMAMDDHLLLRFRSALGDKGASVDGCLLAERKSISYELSFATVFAWEECLFPLVGAVKIGNLKRVTLQRINLSEKANPNNAQGLRIILTKHVGPSLQWDFFLFNAIPDQKIVSWDQDQLYLTQRKIFNDSSINHFFPGLTLALGKSQQNWKISFLKKISNEDFTWRHAQKCHEVDDQCKSLMPYNCDLCESEVLEVFHTNCQQSGTKYCTLNSCGRDNQPACYLGKSHIQQEDFKGCGPYSEEYFCQKGFILFCNEERKIPYCRS